MIIVPTLVQTSVCHVYGFKHTHCVKKCLHGQKKRNGILKETPWCVVCTNECTKSKIHESSKGLPIFVALLYVALDCLRKFKARTSRSPSSSSSNFPISSNLTSGSSGQFLISKINKSRFFAPRWHRRRDVRIPAIEKTHYPYMTTRYPNIALARKATVGNFPSCFPHH